MLKVRSLKQTTARGESWPIDTLCWEFTVLNLEETAFVRPPRDGGVYVRLEPPHEASFALLIPVVILHASPKLLGVNPFSKSNDNYQENTLAKKAMNMLQQEHVNISHK